MQSRWDSPVLKAGLVSLLVFALKEFAGYELENSVAENFVKVLFFIIIAFAEINNPKDSKNI